MYLFLGGNKSVRSDDIIGIFDMDNTTTSAKTRDFLNVAQKRGQIFETSFDLPKSFVVCNKKGTINDKVYLSKLNPSTLKKRSDASFNL